MYHDFVVVCVLIRLHICVGLVATQASECCVCPRVAQLAPVLPSRVLRAGGAINWNGLSANNVHASVSAWQAV